MNKIREIIDHINKTSNANFVERLKNPNLKIDNPDGSFSTHKLSYVTEGNHDVVYPEI